MLERLEKKSLTIGVRFEQSTRDAIKRLANAEERSVADYIRLVLKRHVAERKGEQ